VEVVYIVLLVDTALTEVFDLVLEAEAPLDDEEVTVVVVEATDEDEEESAGGATRPSVPHLSIKSVSQRIV
jgi:hypothetical protein